ncbi:MAG: ATP-binding protein [Terracidiphilus sp.]|jgi:signal transduction histidine kinase
MKLWSTQSISSRLTALVVFVSGTALLLAYLSYLAFDYYSLRHNLIESIDSQANLIGINSETALLFDDQQTAETTLSSLRGEPSILAAEIFRANGTPFARYTRKGTDAGQSIEPRLPRGQTSASWIQDGTVLLGHIVTSDGRPIGTVYILAETRDVAHRASQFGLLLAGILLVCFAISLLATLAMRGSIIRPLENLAATARVVSRKRDYSVRAEVPHRRDEMAFLAQSFNEMLDEIEQSRAVLEQKVAERTAELSAANRELEAFSYTVAHDLRGPLQQVANIGYLLQAEGASPEQELLLDRLVTAAMRMSSLIDDLLNLSRVASAPLKHVSVDLSALARSILDTLTHGSDRKVEKIIAEGCSALADDGLMTVVMENLLRNAWKYSSRKDSTRIEFGCRRQGEETVFFVRDNGAGFDSAYIERLFQPFQRLHSEADFPGTGIGLASVQRIIARHGGRVWATGAVDQGAEFSFTLPQEKYDGESHRTPSG